MRHGRWRRLLLCVALSCCVPGVAAAGGADSAMAEALFQEGRKLVEQKRYAEACPKFAESQRLDPGIGTLLNLASCHELEGKTASAWTEFTQAVGLAERESRPDAQQFARGRLAQLTPKLPKIVITVPAESDVPGLEVSLDGQALGKPAWGVAAPIDPGSHTVAAAATGRKRWATQIAFGAAEQKTVVVPALEVETSAERTVAAPIPTPVPPTTPENIGGTGQVGPAASATAAPAPVPADTRESRRGRTQRAAGLVVGGAGALAMGAGVVLGFVAKSKFNESSDHCDATGCDPAGIDIRDSAVEKGQIATAVFALGAGTAVAGAVLWFTAPADRAVARIGVTPAGVVVSGSW